MANALKVVFIGLFLHLKFLISGSRQRRSPPVWGTIWCGFQRKKRGVHTRLIEVAHSVNIRERTIRSS